MVVHFCRSHLQQFQWARYINDQIDGILRRKLRSSQFSKNHKIKVMTKLYDKRTINLRQSQDKLSIILGKSSESLKIGPPMCIKDYQC